MVIDDGIEGYWSQPLDNMINLFAPVFLNQTPCLARSKRVQPLAMLSTAEFNSCFSAVAICPLWSCLQEKGLINFCTIVPTLLTGHPKKKQLTRESGVHFVPKRPTARPNRV